MARPKRLASMSTSSTESTPERGSPLRKKKVSASSQNKKPTSPSRPKQTAKRGRPTKVAMKKKAKSSGIGNDEETTALVKQLSENSKKSRKGEINSSSNDQKGTSHVADLPTGVVTEADIIAATTPAQISDLINHLVTANQNLIFETYKEKSMKREANDAKIIGDLNKQLEEKQETIDALASTMSAFQKQFKGVANKFVESNGNGIKNGTEVSPVRNNRREMYESPLRSKSSDPMVSDVDDELKTISFTFDLLELLTGVRVIDYKMDDESFLFDVKQTSTIVDAAHDPVSIEYQLLIQRENEGKADITYIPKFLEVLNKKGRDAEQEAKNNDARKVQRHLPEYLQQSLNFPYNTLSQFYTKLTKSLNKSTRE